MKGKFIAFIENFTVKLTFQDSEVNAEAMMIQYVASGFHVTTAEGEHQAQSPARTRATGGRRQASWGRQRQSRLSQLHG